MTEQENETINNWADVANVCILALQGGDEELKGVAAKSVRKMGQLLDGSMEKPGEQKEEQTEKT